MLNSYLHFLKAASFLIFPTLFIEKMSGEQLKGNRFHKLFMHKFNTYS